jgi:hypothetical protein
MKNRSVFAALTTLAVVAAAALGAADAGRAQRTASHAGVLRVKAYGGLARRGFPVYLSFRVAAPASVSVKLTMRLRTSIAVSGKVKRVAPVFDTRQVWHSRVRQGIPAGRYTFCAVAKDAAGHSAKSCASYRVV